MKTNYSIKNFRKFGEDGADVTFSPITILTGCNSSGKSSIAKSLLLLDTFLSKVKKAIEDKSNIEFENYTLDFSEYPLNLLGRFDKVINSSSKTGEMEFGYSCDNGLNVILTFVTRKEDILNRGYLKKLSIVKDGQEVFSSNDGECKMNMLPLFGNYIKSSRDGLAIEYDSYGNCLSFLVDDYKRDHHVTKDTIDWASDNSSLFRLPLLDKIGTFTKDEFLAKTPQLFSKAIKEVSGLDLLLKRIEEVFIESDYLSFEDFFKAREKGWLSNLRNLRSPFDKRDIKYPIDWQKVDYEVPSKEIWLDDLKELNEDSEFLRDCQIGFPMLLTTIDYVGEILGLAMDPLFGKRILASRSCDWSYYEEYTTIHYLWEDFRNFVEKQICKSLSPKWIGELYYVGSSRIDVKRLYTLDAKNDFSNLLQRYFDARRDFIGLPKYEYEKGYEPDAFMNRWLRKFDICDSVSLDLDTEGLGVSIKLHRGNSISLLADEGYGITQLFSILLEIETAIQYAYHHFLTKGYSHNYMFVTDMYTDKILFPEQTIIIEEPEIHLHPKFQSLLADMFAEAANYNIHFIIETHSEYLIRRTQVLVSQMNLGEDDEENEKRNPFRVFYFPDDDKPYDMHYLPNGHFEEAFGTGFFDEAGKSSRELIRNKKK